MTAENDFLDTSCAVNWAGFVSPEYPTGSIHFGVYVQGDFHNSQFPLISF